MRSSLGRTFAVVLALTAGSPALAAGECDSVPTCLTLAEQGDAQAQFVLGNYRSAAKDYVEAFKWYRLSAEQGHLKAQVELGTSYYYSINVAGDPAESVRWFKMAAEQGNEYAQSTLAYIYYYGRGLPQDYAEALKWYRLSAEQGDSFSQNSLGVMYRNGEAVPQDNVLAHMWFNLSAAQGNGEAVENRNLTAAVMTSAQIAEAQRLAREWKAAHPK